MRNIGDLKLENPFVMAPMAGITDSPFRLLAREQGASLTFTEMISAKGCYYNDVTTKSLLHIKEEEGPVGLQLFGSDPEIIKIVIEKLNPLNHVLLDINMGCPVQKVVKNGEGAALMKNRDLAYKVVKAAVEVSEKPVTVKMRLGFDESTINVTEFPKAMEEAGARAISVHARTRDMFYAGKADWSYLKKVKEKVSIPVMGSGDIFSKEDAINMLKETGVDYVMVARGALGNPWIFRECLALWQNMEIPESPSLDEKITMMTRHLTLLKELKGEYRAIREMRKHGGWYVRGFKNASSIKRRINVITDFHELMEFFVDLKQELQ